MALATEHEIQSAYQGREKASKYVDQRFVAPLMELLHRRQVEAVRRVMREAQPRRTLEVAPGPGRVTRDVGGFRVQGSGIRGQESGVRGQETGDRGQGELVCLEFNEGMIAEGRAACGPQVQWVQGNAFELPFGEEFDFLYSFRFVRHFRRPDRERLYEQFRRVLRPGGWLVLDAVNEAVSGSLRAARPQDYPIYDKLYRDEGELRGELEGAGFEVVRLERVQRWFSMQSRVQVLVGPRSTRLCRWLIRGLERVSRGPALEWVVTCRKK